MSAEEDTRAILPQIAKLLEGILPRGTHFILVTTNNSPRDEGVISNVATSLGSHDQLVVQILDDIAKGIQSGETTGRTEPLQGPLP